MKRAAVFWLFATAVLAQPFIYYRGAVNAASFLPPGLPNGAIARGSMFSIFGRGLGPATPQQVSAFPLQPTFAAVTVELTQGTTKVNALPVFVSAAQLNVILPSNTPLGAVSLRVLYNGQTSNPIPITVTATSIGLFSVNGSGFGPGIVQNFSSQTSQPGVACHIIDTATRAIVRTLQFLTTTRLNRPEVSITRDGGLVFLTTGDGVACIDVLTQTYSYTIAEPAQHIAIDGRGTILYLAPVLGPFVTNSNPPPQVTRLQGLAVYDIATSTLIKHIPVERLDTMVMALSQDGATMLISRIPLDPVTQRNGFPERVVVELATGKLTVYPWTGALDPPVTVGTLISVPMP